MHSFISGLQEEIRHGVSMFKPLALEEAYELAESEEKKVESLRRRSYTRSNFSLKPMLNRNTGRFNSDIKATTNFKGGKPSSKFKKGQCFKYGDKWAPGHQCKQKTLHNIEGEIDYEDSDTKEVIAEVSLEEGDNKGEGTLNAITCQSPPSTLKLTAKINDVEIEVLVDSGNTNNFIDPRVLQKLKIKPSKNIPLNCDSSQRGHNNKQRWGYSTLLGDTRTFIYSRH